MKTSFDPFLKSDLLKLGCAALLVGSICALFITTPALSQPTFLGLVGTLLLSPLVSQLERRGYPRTAAIMLLVAALALYMALGGMYLMNLGDSEIGTLKTKAPQYFDLFIAKLRVYESGLTLKYGFLKSIAWVDQIVAWKDGTLLWFQNNGATWIGQLATTAFIAPLITFFLLNDGPAIQKKFFQLIPNRYFETTYLVTYRIVSAISDYVRAKLIEASLVGLMVYVGLLMVGAPYALVLGLIAGVTNILPYIGPLVGALPGVLVAVFDSSGGDVIFKVSMVYVAANLVDTVFIFPVVVAKLVDLHPLLLIAVVTAGQRYYGLVGMLISIPLAAATKVILQEIYAILYIFPSNRSRLSETRSSTAALPRSAGPELDRDIA